MRNIMARLLPQHAAPGPAVGLAAEGLRDWALPFHARVPARRVPLDRTQRSYKINSCP